METTKEDILKAYPTAKKCGEEHTCKVLEGLYPDIDFLKYKHPITERIEAGEVWKEWLAKVMSLRPHGNMYLDSPRGIEVTKMCLAYEKSDFSWHRSDEDTFWIDVQMFVKYKHSDEEILFIMKQQPGVENYSKHSAERNAYAEFMRGLTKLRNINYRKNMERQQTQLEPSSNDK